MLDVNVHIQGSTYQSHTKIIQKKHQNRQKDGTFEEICGSWNFRPNVNDPRGLNNLAS